MVAPVKACNFTNIRLRHGYIFVKFLKLFGRYFDALLEFSKSSKNTGEKIFAKYLSADGCLIKTVMITTTVCFLIRGRLRSFTWSTRAIHLRSSSTFLYRLKFWFAKKLKMNLCIAPKDASFCKYRNHAKILIVLKQSFKNIVKNKGS